MTPEQVLIIQMVAKAGRTNADALEAATGWETKKLRQVIRTLVMSKHLRRAGASRITRSIYVLTEDGQAFANGPALQDVEGGKKFYTTLVNARVQFATPADDPRDMMRRPTYELPKIATPMRAGALDAFRLPSKGLQ